MQKVFLVLALGLATSEAASTPRGGQNRKPLMRYEPFPAHETAETNRITLDNAGMMAKEQEGKDKPEEVPDAELLEPEEDAGDDDDDVSDPYPKNDDGTRVVPKKDVGLTFCKYCRRTFDEFDHNQFTECEKTSLWGDGTVNLDSARRRSNTCFQPSHHPSQGLGDGRNANRDDRIAIRGKSTSNGELLCNCMNILLTGKKMNGDVPEGGADFTGCADPGCVNTFTCACGGTCDDFKTKMGCPSSMLESSSTLESLAKRSDRLNSSSPEVKEASLDETLADKCAR